MTALPTILSNQTKKKGRVWHTFSVLCSSDFKSAMIGQIGSKVISTKQANLRTLLKTLCYFGYYLYTNHHAHFKT